MGCTVKLCLTARSFIPIMTSWHWTNSALLDLCERIPTITGRLPPQKASKRTFDVFFVARLDKLRRVPVFSSLVESITNIHQGFFVFTGTGTNMRLPCSLFEHCFINITRFVDTSWLYTLANVHKNDAQNTDKITIFSNEPCAYCNSLWCSDAKWRHRCCSPFFQARACRLYGAK